MAITLSTRAMHSMANFSRFSESHLTHEPDRPRTRRGCISDALLFARYLAQHGNVSVMECAIYVAIACPDEYHISAVHPIEKGTSGVILFTDMSRLVFERSGKYLKLSWIRRSGSRWFHSVWEYRGVEAGDKRIF